jgi:hypothetical protein
MLSSDLVEVQKALRSTLCHGENIDSAKCEPLIAITTGNPIIRIEWETKQAWRQSRRLRMELQRDIICALDASRLDDWAHRGSIRRLSVSMKLSLRNQIFLRKVICFNGRIILLIRHRLIKEAASLFPQFILVYRISPGRNLSISVGSSPLSLRMLRSAPAPTRSLTTSRLTLSAA